MTFDNALPLLILLTSLMPGTIIFLLPEDRRGARTALNMTAAVTKLILTGILVWGVHNEHVYQTRLPFLPGIELLLDADAFSVLLVALSSVLWFVTTLYAIAYLEHSPQSRSRFFGFFSLCVTLDHRHRPGGQSRHLSAVLRDAHAVDLPAGGAPGNRRSMRAGKVYLAYTIGGGSLFLAAVAWLWTIAGPLEFTEGGMLHRVAGAHAPELRLIFFMLVAGLGVKAALVPLHGWLPQAMVAPAPVSALLHAVAVVKAGAFGIVRVVYDVYGVGWRPSSTSSSAGGRRGGHRRLRVAARAGAGQPEEAAGLFDGQPGLLHRARRRHPGARRGRGRRRPPGPPGADENHALLLRRQPRRKPRGARHQPHGRRRAPPARPP